MDTNILSALCDQHFAVKSFKEYTDSRTVIFENLITLLQEVVTSDETLTSSEIAGLISKYGFNPHCCVPVQGTHYDLTELLEGLNAVASPDVNVDFPADILSTPIPNGQGLPLTFAEISDSVVSDLHSIVCVSAACAAQISEGVDRLVKFRDSISSKFKSAHSDISNSLSFFTELISAQVDDGTFLGQLFDSMNLEALAQQDDPNPMDSDIGSYTGASPSSAYCFSNTVALATSTLKIGMMATLKVTKSILGLVVKGVRWLGAKVYQTVVDPDDLFVANEQGSPTIDGFSFDKTEIVNYALDGFTYPPDQLMQYLQSTDFDSKIGVWIKFDLIGCEVLLKINQKPEFTYDDESGFINGINFSVTYKARFKCLNLESAAAAEAQYATPITFETFADRLNFQRALGLYYNSDNTEKEKYLGFVASSTLMPAYLSVAIDQMLGYDAAWNPAVKSAKSYLDLTKTNFSVNNNNWVSVASYYGTGAAVNGHPLTVKPGNVANTVAALCTAFLLSQMDSFNNPLDFAWVPYSKKVTDMAPAKYGIKTDETNRAAFDNFATTAIIATIAVVATVTLGVACAKIAKKFFFKRTQFLGQMDNKMWNGGKLTPAEERKYVRYQRKQAASSYISKSIQGSSNEESTVLANTNSLIDSLRKLITG